MTSQFLAPALRDGDEEVEHSLRPRRLDDFVGQERIKEQLEIALEAAKGRGEALDHVLLVGPPGLGKTTLATIIREELGVGIRTVAGPGARAEGRHGGDPHGRSSAQDVLFVDEIHRVNRAIEEILYPALEDFRLDIIVGQGAGARTLTLDLPPFTLVGATTRTGLLTTPLRDRFGMTFRLGYYERDELATIVRRSAGILGVEIADEAADEIARPRARHAARREPDPAPGPRRRRGAPRRERSRSTSRARRSSCSRSTRPGSSASTASCCRRSSHKFGGGPVGLSTLAVSLGEEPDTIEDVYEPYLLQLGFLQRTPRGRVITELGREHIGAERAGRRALLRSMSAQVWTPGAAGPLDEFVEPAHAHGRGFRDRASSSSRRRCASSSSTGRVTRSRRRARSPASGSSRSRPHRDDGDEPQEADRPDRCGRGRSRSLRRIPSGRSASSRPSSARQPPVLQLAPGRHGCELEQRAAALRLRVAEVARVVDPRRRRAGPP